MRIAIVEDAPEARLELKGFCERYCRERSIEAQLALFESGEAFLEAAPEGFDLVLLDIEMGELSGMDTARRLRQTDRRAQIIFVTYLVQYAIDGYSVDAVDFIAKPVSYPAFCAGMDRAMKRIAFYAPRYLSTSYAREPISALIQQIAFIESLNKRTIIHMADGAELRSSEPLYALEEKLAGEAFFRCHNAYLVNLRHVRTVNATELTVPGQRIPISKYRKREFFEKLAACRAALL